MRILYYNWVPFDEELRGGGVTVYTRNLINSILNLYPDDEVYFLCAGCYYDTEDNSIRYEQIKLKYESKCKAYAIINSPVFAPAYLSFFHMEKMMSDKTLKPVFVSFLKEKGPFDVVHFQNFEGLSIDCLQLKKEFTHTRFVYSIHNYFAFCPRVDLWKESKENCMNKDTDEKCIKCMICHVPTEKLRKKMAIDYMQRLDDSPEKIIIYNQMRRKIDEEYAEEEKKIISDEENRTLTKCLCEYRKKLVGVVNENMDEVLAVSERVKEIAINMGVDRSRLITSYIGTKVAETAINYYKGSTQTPLSMIYMGYQNTEKGYYFLLKVLDAMTSEIADKIKIMIIARGNDYNEEILKIHKQKFNSVKYQNGYKREEIYELLKEADFGIVPVLWEDNLPQVAIEMAAHGVPVLCSDRGGAKELTSNADFVFVADDVNSCIEKIRKIVENPKELEGYYDNYHKLTTMKKHADELIRIYSGKN